MNNIYITIPSSGVGGAERRFVDIFIGLVQKNMPVYLVIPSFLYIPLFEEIKEEYSKNIILLEINKWSFVKFCYKFFLFFIKKSRPGDHFHYPLNPLFFFHLFNKTTYSISFCHSSIIPSFKSKSGGLILQRLSIRWSRKIDILNISVFDSFVKKFPKYAKKVTVTPGGTYIRNIEIKENNRDKIVFLSRLVPGKGVDTFIELVQKIDKYLKNKYSLTIPFYIYGEGPLKEYVIEKTNELKGNNIDIIYGGFAKVSDIFPNSKCVFSLQDVTNYPSRVIAEALSYGCNVIASDTGDTKEFGNLLGLWYFSTIDELFEKIDFILENKFNSNEIINSANKRFTSEKYIDYFSQVFDNYDVN